MLWKFHKVALGARAAASAMSTHEEDVFASPPPLSAKSSNEFDYNR